MSRLNHKRRDHIPSSGAPELLGSLELGLELAGIERHFGKLLGHAARIVGRKGVDAFVSMAMAGFGL
jgi:hypothetical protein